MGSLTWLTDRSKVQRPLRRRWIYRAKLETCLARRLTRTSKQTSGRLLLTEHTSFFFSENVFDADGVSFKTVLSKCFCFSPKCRPLRFGNHAIVTRLPSSVRSPRARRGRHFFVAIVNKGGTTKLSDSLRRAEKVVRKVITSNIRFDTGVRCLTSRNVAKFIKIKKLKLRREEKHWK